jgi:hypothetical protein
VSVAARPAQRELEPEAAAQSERGWDAAALRRVTADGGAAAPSQRRSPNPVRSGRERGRSAGRRCGRVSHRAVV